MKMRNTIFVHSIIGLLLFGAGLVLGGNWGVGQAAAVSSGDQASGTVKTVINGLGDLTAPDDIDFAFFWKVWEQVKAKHVDQDATDEELFYGALQGMVSAIGDPYTVFLPPEPADQFMASMEGEKFEGIGAEIGIRDNQLVVIAPLPESPAEKAGMLAGDAILAVNGTSTLGMSVESAVKIIRGKGGTTVTLLVIHNGENVPVEVPIIRGQIKVPTILWEMKEGNIAHIRISHFNQNTWKELDEVIKSITSDGVNGVVLDLRNNPGGYLDMAVAVSSEWLDDGDVVVSERLFDDSSQVLYAKGKNRLKDIKTIVLINGGSASASEIVAGALRDHGKAILMGQQSFGKGSVQDLENFPDGSALKVTIAKWFTPNETAIDGEGITPDEVFEKAFITKYEQETGEEPPALERDEEGTPVEDEFDREMIDLVLEKAIEILAN